MASYEATAAFFFDFLLHVFIRMILDCGVSVRR